MDIVSLLIGFAVGGLVFGIACFFAGISHRKKKSRGYPWVRRGRVQADTQ